MKLSKALIRKYGISKTAWAHARAGNKSRGGSMAKGKKRSRSRSSFGGGAVNKALIGLGAGMLVSRFVGSNVLIKGAAGYFMGGPIGAAAAAFGENVLAGGTSLLGGASAPAGDGW